MPKEYRLPQGVVSELARHDHVLGVDEAGVGSWAGPAIVCAVVVPASWSLEGLTDSKKMTPAARQRLYPSLKELMHVVVRLDVEEIDSEGIGRALPQAHARAVREARRCHAESGHAQAPFAIIDGINAVEGATAVPKADSLVQAVSAASVIAKVTHDEILRQLDHVYPGYGFASHLGYGSPAHRRALLELGVSRCHRMSYAPMRSLVQRDGDILAVLGEVE